MLIRRKLIRGKFASIGTEALPCQKACAVFNCDI